MNQLAIDFAARARVTDPATSHQAAARVDAKTVAGRVLESLRVYGPADSDQLAARLGLKLVTVSPRLRPLERAGFVREHAIRDGRIVWAACPTPEERAYREAQFDRETGPAA